jgi:hypothetical protein
MATKSRDHGNSYTSDNIFKENAASSSPSEIRGPGPPACGSLEFETVKCGHESCGGRTWEWVRWRRPTAIAYYRPILSSGRMLPKDYESNTIEIRNIIFFFFDAIAPIWAKAQTLQNNITTRNYILLVQYSGLKLKQTQVRASDAPLIACFSVSYLRNLNRCENNLFHVVCNINTPLGWEWELYSVTRDV